jgi:hypothetical protein
MKANFYFGTVCDPQNSIAVEEVMEMSWKAIFEGVGYLVCH